MDENQNREALVQFNAREFFFESLRWKYIVITILAVSLLVSFIYTKFFCTPLYNACSKILILNSNSEQVGSSEYSVSTYLTMDFSILITEREVLEDVIEQLDLKMSYEMLKNSITVKNPQSTRILEIYVLTNDPELSMDVANKICDVSRDKIVDLMGIDRVNIFSSATLPKKPSSPNLEKNLLMGALIGASISALFLLIMYYRNDKINGSDGVQAYLGLCTLATIPFNQNRGIKNENHRPRKKVKRK